MIDLSCDKLTYKDIVKCSLGFRKSEMRIFELLSAGRKMTASEISVKLKISLTAAQRGLKRLCEKRTIERLKETMAAGGYYYAYKSLRKEDTRKLILATIDKWRKKVESEIDRELLSRAG